MFGQSATILEMQQKLNKQVAALYPTIRTSVNKTVPPFYTEAVNALSYQLAAGTNTLNNYGVQSPLMDWVDFLQANVKALTEFPDAIADFTSDEDYNLRIDFSFVELNESISTLYNKAAADYETKACQGRILSSMNTYSNAVSKNISDAIAFMNRGLSNDAGNEVKLMKKTYTDFHNNITVCSNKRPLSICRSCMLTLVEKAFWTKLLAWFKFFFASFSCLNGDHLWQNIRTILSISSQITSTDSSETLRSRQL